MDVVIKHGCPIALDSALAVWLFMLAPALLAGLGATILRGSALRIVGGALGAGLRDFAVLVSVSGGWLTVTNPHWEDLVSTILVLFCMAGGALGSCLAPYRGKFLFLNAAIGGFLGQFCLPYVLLKKRFQDGTTKP